MSIYSTFFLAEPDHLPSAFPGWKLPLPKPVTRTTVNPFTRKETTITTRAPEWEDFDPENMELPVPQVVTIEGDYQLYLEQRIPPLVRSMPHWCAKNLTPVELEPLAAIVTGTDNAKLESALYAHPALGCGIVQFSEHFVARLKGASDNELASIHERWAAGMSTREYTHSANGERLSDDWSPEDAQCLLNPIAALARQQSAGQVLYLLIES